MKTCRYERLHREVVAYLAFMDEARTEDPLWREYQAWKQITEKRAVLKERLSLYTMR